MIGAEREELEIRLIAALKENHAQLRKVLDGASDHWGYEDPIYRFYHHSFKVFPLQGSTITIIRTLRALLPDVPLNRMFEEIVAAGTGKRFNEETNNNWSATTRPIVEAFFHARFFLEMAVKYAAEIEEPPMPLPSGWAAFLYLFNIR